VVEDVDFRGIWGALFGLPVPLLKKVWGRWGSPETDAEARICIAAA
jgi:hypothetical protein